MVFLRGPSGNKWRVELVANNMELCFVHGWKEFLSDNRIQPGYFLVFCYNGQSQFSVTVFDSAAHEAPYAFLSRPSNDRVTEEDEGMGTNADDTDPEEEGTDNMPAENGGT